MTKQKRIDQIMRTYTFEQLKEMYKADRKLIQDRLYRMGKTEFRESRTYQKYYNKLPKVRELKTKEDLAAAFFDTDRLIRSGFTTMARQRAQKQKVLAGLHANNYDFVNEDNYWSFYNFMEWFEDNKLKPVYGSPTDEAMQSYLDAVAARADPKIIQQLYLEWLDAGQKGTFGDYLRENY